MPEKGLESQQALTGTRYPTLPGLFFYYPYPTRNFFENFRVQGSNYTCCFQSIITTMMPATFNFKEQVQKRKEENLCLFKISIRTEFKRNVSSIGTSK